MKFFSAILALLLTVNAFAVGIKEFSENKIRFGTGSGDREIVFDQSPDGSSAKITVDASTDTVNVNNATNVNNRFKVVSTTKSSVPCPAMTEVQRDALSSPADGDCVYNTTKHSLNIYNSAASKWKATGSGAGGSRLNLMTDSSFEDGVTEGTCTNCTATQEGTALMVTPSNEKSLKMAFSASTGGYAVDKTTGSEFDGVQGVVSCWIKTDKAGVQFIARSAGTDSSDLIKNVNSDGIARLYEIPVTLGSTSVGFNVKASSSITGNVYVDECMAGPAKVTGEAAVVTSWNSYTLTIGGSTSAPTLGTNTAKAYWRQVGSDIEIIYYVEQSSSGSAGSGTYLFPIPSGFTIDTNKVTAGSFASTNVVGTASAYTNASAPRVGVVNVFNSTNLSIAVGDAGSNPTSVGSGYMGVNTTSVVYTFTARVPVTQLAGSVATYSSSNADTDWVTFTPTSSVWSTNTTWTGKWMRKGSMMRLQIKVTLSGAPSAGTLTINMPSGFTIDTTKLVGTGLAPLGWGQIVDNGVGNYFTMMAYASTTTVQPLVQGAGSTWVKSENGIANTQPFTFGSGDYAEWDFSVPIVGWSDGNVTVASFSPPKDEIFVTGGNGHGSTNTKFRRYTTVATSEGSAITYADSATLGGSFTINQSGLYGMTICDGASTAGNEFGISKSTAGTTNLTSISDADRLLFLLNTTASVGWCNCGSTPPKYYPAGTVIRAHTNGTVNATGNYLVNFRITRVSL